MGSNTGDAELGGVKLVLQVGGAQDAVMDAPPGLVFVTAPEVLAVAVGWFDVQVSGTPVIILGGLFASVTVGTILKPEPLLPRNVVPPELRAKLID